MKYKNITNTDLIVPNVGIIKAGEIVETDIDINNQNFKKVEEIKIASINTKEEDKSNN